jgi:hypothetical protein
MIYLIGSLRNPQVLEIASEIRKTTGWEVFDDWYAAGPEADDMWRDYEKQRGRNYRGGLEGLAAKHVFDFDLHHLNRATGGVLVLPAGRSGHLELGYLIGQGKPGYILLDDPERWDVMYRFAKVCFTKEELIEDLHSLKLAKPVTYAEGKGVPGAPWAYGV